MKILLSETKLFRGIDKSEIWHILECLGAVEKSFARGEYIMREGDTTDSLGLVLSGSVVMEYSDAWGQNSLIGSARPGEVFAESYACIPGERLMISVRAAEDAEILLLSVARLLDGGCGACRKNPTLLRNLLTVCAGRSLALSHRIVHTSPKTIRARLMSYFSECAKRSGGGAFVVPYNRQQLADYLSVDRSTMCSELTRMRRCGMISFEKNRFEILTPAEE